MVSKRFTKCLVIVMGVLLILGSGAGFVLAAEKEVSPMEWLALEWKERIEKKTVTVRTYQWVSDWMAEEALPRDVMNLSQRIHSGDVDTPLNWYNVSLFETAHPEVRIEPITFAPWMPESVSDLLARMAAGNAPGVFQLIPSTAALVSQGVLADITDLVTGEWLQSVKEELIPIWKKLAWVNGRCYATPSQYFGISCINYRIDWFEEAGIFNKEGKAAPPDNWTWEDFRTIAKKITNKKQRRWGIAYDTLNPIGRVGRDLVSYYAATHGWPIVDPAGIPWITPDKTREYTWRAGYIAPIAEGFKFYNAMRWEDESLLLGQTMNAGVEFTSGRTGMYFSDVHYWTFLHCFTPHRFDPVKETKDILGAVMPPVAAQWDMPVNAVLTDRMHFDPTLDQRHLKAAFDWVNWNYANGVGFINRLYNASNLQAAGIEGAGKWDFAFYLGALSYKLDFPYVNRYLDKMTEKFPEQSKMFLEIAEKGLEIPSLPYAPDYGLDIRDSGEIDLEQRELRFLILAEKNITTDTIKEYMEKAAEKVNKKLLNYKVKGDQENFEAYFQALSDFYRNNYPEFYGGGDYEQNCVSYFKF